MGTRLIAAVLLLALLLSLAGCGEQDDRMEVRIAYCAARAADPEAVVYATRRIASADGERLCSLVLQLAMTEPPEESMTSAFPRRTTVRSVDISEQGVITVDFSEGYAALQGIRRTLADACVVQTLFSLGSVGDTDISGVRITVEGEGERTILTPGSIVDSEDYLRLRDYELHICFPDRAGETLETDVFSRTFSDREEPAETVMALLLNGRRSNGSLTRLVTEETVFYGLEIRSRVCVLNFNEAFLDTEGLRIGDSMLRLYAFVDSLCQLPHIDRVQFLIEGEVVTAPQYDNFDLPYAPIQF